MTNVLIFRRGGRLYPALTADRLRAVRIETGKELEFRPEPLSR